MGLENELEKDGITTWYGVECYFKNPETGETGWEIKFVDLHGKNMLDAVSMAKSMPHFDCFIDLEFQMFDEY